MPSPDLDLVDPGPPDPGRAGQSKPGRPASLEAPSGLSSAHPRKSRLAWACIATASLATLFLARASESLASPPQRPATAHAQQGQAAPIAGSLHWDDRHFIDYQAGNLPIIISAPHGGRLAPADLADRSSGVTGSDTNSSELARALRLTLIRETGRAPHLIVCNLHRIKLDANREIVEAAQGDPQAEQAWRDYHAFIEQAKAAVTEDFGAGLYIDLHGHGHAMPWTELGYLLPASELDGDDAALSRAAMVDRSSLRSLAGRMSRERGSSLAELLRGPMSLGGLLQAQGRLTVPSPAHPGPAGNDYFNGGYNTAVHGSRDGGRIDSSQFETAFPDAREDADVRAAYADSVTEVLDRFFEHWYAQRLRPDASLSLALTHPFVGEAGSAGDATGIAHLVVERRGALDAALDLRLDLAGDAEAGRDFEAFETAIHFAAGQSQLSRWIQPIDDAETEGVETLRLRLSGSPLVTLPNEAALVFVDDELPQTAAGIWSMDEASGSRLVDRSGAAHDGRLSTQSGAAPERIPARLGRGLRFDGRDDHALIDDFDYGSSGEFSVAFWLRAEPTGGSGFQYLLSHGAAGTQSSLNVYFMEHSGRLRTSFRDADDPDTIATLDHALRLMDGAWHHFVLSAGREDLARVYVDGQEAASSAMGGDAFDPEGALVLGGRSDRDAARFFAGDLDELRIYDRRLGISEIRWLMEPGPAPTPLPTATSEPGQTATREATAAVTSEDLSRLFLPRLSGAGQ